MNKNIIILIFIALGIIGYFWINKEATNVIQKIAESSEQEKTVESRQDKENFSRAQNSVDNDFTHPVTKNLSIAKCGIENIDIEKLRMKLTPTLYSQTITEEMQNAIDQLTEHCLSWFDYLENQDEDGLKQQKIEFTHRKEKMDKFSFGEYDPELTQEAYSYLKGSDSDLAGMALTRILKYDNQFKAMVLKEAGIGDLNYLYQNNLQLGILYSCHLSHDCYSSETLSSYNGCLINPSTCSQGTFEMLRNMYTPSQMLDYEIILQIIIKRINALD